MQQHDANFKVLNGELVAISFEPMEVVQREAQELGLTFPVLSDTSLSSYKDYGLARGSFFQVYNPVAAWRYLWLLLKGRRAHGAHGDLRQLGGDFVIDDRGILRYAHPSTRSEQRPGVGTLLQELRSL